LVTQNRTYKIPLTDLEVQMNDFGQKIHTVDLGTTKPTSVPTEIIEVVVGSESLVPQFAKSFLMHARTRNPLLMRELDLTAQEIDRYTKYLISKRIEVIDNDCRDFQKLRVLYMPAMIQYTLSVIGRVDMREIGLTIKPVLAPLAEGEELMTYSEALDVSEKLGKLERDMAIVKDGMPRGQEGDSDVMSCALIEGYIRAIRPVQHVSATYMAAFAGFQTRKNFVLNALYRVQYDDVAYVTEALIRHNEIYA